MGLNKGAFCKKGPSRFNLTRLFPCVKNLDHFGPLRGQIASKIRPKGILELVEFKGLAGIVRFAGIASPKVEFTFSGT